MKREEEEKVAAAAALREIQERLERQKAAAEARRLAAMEGDGEESVELIEFRRAQEEMRRACEEAVVSLESQKGQLVMESNHPSLSFISQARKHIKPLGWHLFLPPSLSTGL